MAPTYRKIFLEKMSNNWKSYFCIYFFSVRIGSLALNLCIRMITNVVIIPRSYRHRKCHLDAWCDGRFELWYESYQDHGDMAFSLTIVTTFWLKAKRNSRSLYMKSILFQLRSKIIQSHNPSIYFCLSFLMICRPIHSKFNDFLPKLLRNKFVIYI